MDNIKMYYPDEIPKETCFSNNNMTGAYYEDTEDGEKKSWHRYNKNGWVVKTNVTPYAAVKYYISDKYGNPIKTKEEHWYQYMMYNKSLKSYFVTEDKYRSTQDVEDKYICYPEIDYRYPIKESLETKIIMIKEVEKWQWLYRVSVDEKGVPCNGYHNEWNISGLKTLKEADKAYEGPKNILEWSRVSASRKVVSCD